MAFLQFPISQYFRIFETGETEVKGGYFILTTGTDLLHIMATIFINGTLAGSERMRFNIYGNDTSTTPIYSSDWADLSAIGAYTLNWLGNIYFDFEAAPLNPNLTYYIRIEIENYTRNFNTFYIGVNLDWVSEVNTPLSATSRGFRIRILGER